ncbi:sugar ABC transporter substrate-binding protein [Candidatus Poriferisodalis sp.]|uniref:sugar ABC transporter substrate-binding protein n=1 Tax=Candidatus Poriferisodalis sp. TaxID=3101277 RepID=UPI003B526EE5
MKARTLMKLLGAVLALTLFVAACGDGDDDSDATTDVTAAATPTVAEPAAGDDEPDATDAAPAEPDDSAPATTAAPAETTDEPEPEPWRIAYLSASSANTFLLASVGEMQRLADENNIELVEFDAQFNAELQTTQLQDAIASSQYDGIILVALNGPGLVPDVEAALASGLQVVLFNQIVGDDLSTNEPQVDGIAASVMAPPVVTGERAGRLTVQACEGLDPCRVVYLFGIRGFPLDVALRQGFDSAVAGHANIDVVAEGEGMYLGPEGGINAMQDILQAQPDFDVVVGADQSLQGVELVLTDEGKLDGVALIGLGGSSPAIEGVRDGRWFATVYYAPASEGRLAMEAMIAALSDGSITGGIDPNANFIDEGLVTSANVDQFTAEWDG